MVTVRAPRRPATNPPLVSNSPFRETYIGCKSASRWSTQTAPSSEYALLSAPSLSDLRSDGITVFGFILPHRSLTVPSDRLPTSSLCRRVSAAARVHSSSPVAARTACQRISRIMNPGLIRRIQTAACSRARSEKRLPDAWASYAAQDFRPYAWSTFRRLRWPYGGDALAPKPILILNASAIRRACCCFRESNVVQIWETRHRIADAFHKIKALLCFAASVHFFDRQRACTVIHRSGGHP
ncbi:hypothetical protein PSAC2689_70251 [Paraburkholderia sacchari]